jgi:hypothetical protein
MTKFQLQKLIKEVIKESIRKIGNTDFMFKSHPKTPDEVIQKIREVMSVAVENKRDPSKLQANPLIPPVGVGVDEHNVPLWWEIRSSDREFMIFHNRTKKWFYGRETSEIDTDVKMEMAIKLLVSGLREKR